MKFAFIDAEKAFFPVAVLCRLLLVSRQGYYAYCARDARVRSRDEAAHQQLVKHVFEQSRQTYGSPRVWAALRQQGVFTSKRRVERAMRSQGLAARRPRAFRRTTKANLAHRTEPNVLARDFAATKPNQRWVTDITYVWTDEGWAYVATLLDLFSRAVVGWSLDATLSTDLPIRALEMACSRRTVQPGLLHHSDRGCQYTSERYRTALAEQGIEVSMSRKGNCWDNAVAESFFSTLKSELTERRRWRSRLELRDAVFEYIECFYNRQRLHSTLHYKTPLQIEREYAQAAAA